jgi:alpha-beta hydrolase superfamily lysophospholipase
MDKNLINPASDQRIEMFHEEFTLNARDGTRLFAQGWRPAQIPKAAICLVHGIGEHSGRYEYVGEFFARRGCALLALDLRGHGRSEGQRGHSPSLDILIDDIGRLHSEAVRRHPRVPLFLYGHSLGGVLAINYVLRHKPTLNGAVIASPALQNAIAEQRWKVAVARVLGSLFPRLTLPTDIDPACVSRDESVVQALLGDRLVHRDITLGLGKCGLAAMSWAVEHAGDWTLPVLVMHGTADRLAFPSGSEEFARRVSGDCTLKMWPSCYHELHNEPEREQVLLYGLEWMEQRCDSLLRTQISGEVRTPTPCSTPTN